MPDSPFPFPRRRTGILLPGRRPVPPEASPSVADLTARAGLHEVYAASAADGPAAAGFVLGAVAQRLDRAGPGDDGGPQVVWVRQDWLGAETGRIHAPGLAEYRLPPAALALVAARDVLGVLQAGLEAARCAALVAVIIEFEGASRLYDLTASRKLNRAALASGVALYLLRHGAAEVASAAETRWRVGALASRPLAANAAGFPAFSVTLVRNRSGRDGQDWAMEWNGDRACFDDRAALSGAVVPLSADRAVAAAAARRRDS